MTVFSESQIKSLTESAIAHFKCEEVRFGYGSGKEPKEITRKRNTIKKVAPKFFRVMNSRNPPRNEDEAVRMAMPFGVWLVAFIIETIAEECIRWFYQRTRT